jgi:hypothetical protein
MKKRKCSKMFSFRRRRRLSSTTFRNLSIFTLLNAFSAQRSEKCWRLSNESFSIKSRISTKSSTNYSRFVLSSWCNCSLRFSSSAYSRRIIQKRSRKSTSSRWKRSIKEITRFRKRIDRSHYWTSSKKFLNSSWTKRFCDTHLLLFDTFMKCRKKRFIETTLKFFIEQIHIVWKQKTNRMITLLNLNITSVFNTMSHVRLIHDMKKRKISIWIIDWISNFLFDRFTIFAMNRKIIESFSMQIEISQNFSLFSILYLFYNVDLLKMCNKFEMNTKFFEYVDDVNILIYEKSIDENCRNLEKMHKLCERWAIRHEFVFVSIKYELIHFIKNSKKFDMMITIKIDSNTIQSRIDIRVLDVQIDTWLKWDSHVRKIQEKMTKQIMIFTKLLIFIWKRHFARLECCTFSLFARFSFTTSSFDTCSRIKNRKLLTNSQSYKIAVYETFLNRFESFRFRFWKLRRTSSSSICIWISCRLKSNIACK